MVTLRELWDRIGDADKMLDEIRRDLRQVSNPSTSEVKPHYEIKDPSGIVDDISIATAFTVVCGTMGKPHFYCLEDVIPVLRHLYRMFNAVGLFHVHLVVGNETNGSIVAWITPGAVKDMKS